MLIFQTEKKRLNRRRAAVNVVSYHLCGCSPDGFRFQLEAMRVFLISCVLLCTLLHVTESIKCYVATKYKIDNTETKTEVEKKDCEGNFCFRMDGKMDGNNVEIMACGSNVTAATQNQAKDCTEWANFRVDTKKGSTGGSCCDTVLCNSAPTLHSLLTAAIVTSLAVFLH